MGAAVWTWPSAAHPASGTPGAAGPRRRRRRGILGWRARAAPSATRLSASQSNCSEAKKGRDVWPAANLIWSMRIPSQSRLFPSTTKENLKLRTRQPVSLFSGFANNSAQKRSRCESVCLGESDCVWAAEGLERNLALDFTSDWPTFRIKKKIGSDIPFLYALWFLLEEFYDWRSKYNGWGFFLFLFFVLLWFIKAPERYFDLSQLIRGGWNSVQLSNVWSCRNKAVGTQNP